MLCPLFNRTRNFHTRGRSDMKIHDGRKLFPWVRDGCQMCFPIEEWKFTIFPWKRFPRKTCLTNVKTTLSSWWHLFSRYVVSFWWGHLLYEQKRGVLDSSQRNHMKTNDSSESLHNRSQFHLFVPIDFLIIYYLGFRNPTSFIKWYTCRWSCLVNVVLKINIHAVFPRIIMEAPTDFDFQEPSFSVSVFMLIFMRRVFPHTCIC